MIRRLLLLPLLALAMLSFTPAALAYNADEMREDCLAAEALYEQQKGNDPYRSLRAGRCIAYVAGFADGYAISDFLGDKIGVRLNAFCLPEDGDLSHRMVRAVLAHLERQPPKSQTSTAVLVAAALAKTFPCADSEPVATEAKKR